jgi:hypothetical protein
VQRRIGRHDLGVVALFFYPAVIDESLGANLGLCQNTGAAAAIVGLRFRLQRPRNELPEGAQAASLGSFFDLVNFDGKCRLGH